jgi:hypothetical protein
MAKVPGFAKAFAGRWRIGTANSSSLSKRRISARVSPTVKLHSVRNAAEFFNSLLAAGGEQRPRVAVRDLRGDRGR